MEIAEVKKKRRAKNGLLFEDTTNNFKHQFGVVDKDNQRSCYLEVRSWVKPRQGLNLHVEMKRFQRVFQIMSNTCTNELLKDYVKPFKLIRNLQFSETHSDKVRVNNRFTFFSIELTMFFDKKQDIRDEVLNSKLKMVCECIVELLEDEKNLIFIGKKKEG